ncbi:MAG: tRNA (N(6)-L-threonylcarbamoyladenosine(37)-C(2))-methylthiotransferase MtaB [Mycoplasma sp.]
MTTFAIATLGCKVNTYESQTIANELKSHGLIEVDFNAVSDIYIINTCSVTNTADLKSRNIIRRARKNNPNSIVIAAGCYTQTSSKEVLDNLSVDIVIGNKYKNNIYSLIEQYISSKEKFIKVDNLLLEKEFEVMNFTPSSDRVRAFVKIQDGCNFMCSYCSIPFTRGKQRSATKEVIINQIKELVKMNYHEIVLTGVNTAGYLNGDDDFLSLLKTINELDGDFRIRISSVEPFQISDKIIDIIMNNKKRFCNHWHLCLQSGSDEILEMMNRKYSLNQFRELVNKIKIKNPDVSITTDLIVGFPTETNEQHLSSMNFIKEIEFSSCHIFPYSKRKGTAASHFNDLHGSLKKERMDEAIKINKELLKNFLNKFIGKEVEVIFEENNNGVFIGKTSEYIKVLCNSEKEIEIGKIYNMKVLSVITDSLICNKV